jgi:putative alpha-1,2-mannosidase
MAQVVEYQIKGTSDVPQQVDKAKKAMSEMDRQTQAIGKKFTEFGKDLFMGFLAPMVLVQQAVSFISASIAKARQDAKDAVDFAAGIKIEELKASPVDPTTRYMAQKLQVDIRTEKEKEQAALARQTVTEEFLKRDPRGREYFFKAADTGDEGPGMSEAALSTFKYVQDAVAKMVEADMAKALKEEQAKAKETKEKQGEKPAQVFAEANATFGVGNSPQMNILNQQVELQKQANEYLAVIAAASGSSSDFTKDQSNGNASKNIYYQTTNVS